MTPNPAVTIPDLIADLERGQLDKWKPLAKRALEMEAELEAALMVQNSAIVQDTGELVRYGIRWNGPREPIADSTLPGGYWTPWHIAQERLGAGALRPSGLNLARSKMTTTAASLSHGKPPSTS